MSNELTREDRYIVFKIADLGNSLKGDEIRKLAREYAEQRRTKGKEPLRGLFVESDWPEYEPTWKAIEARVTGAQPAPSVPEVTVEMEHAFYEKVTVTTVGSIVGLAEGIKAALLAVAPEEKP